jgi:hypothetical protein
MAEGDHFRNRDQQRAGLPKRMQPALRKYIQAQRALCDWLPHEVTPETVVMSPEELYKNLERIGFTWLPSRGYWSVAHTSKGIKKYEEGLK